MKAVAIDLATTIENRLAEMVKWEEKPETRDAVRIIIRDQVYKLPESSYPDEELPLRINKIYDYYYTLARAA